MIGKLNILNSDFVKSLSIKYVFIRYTLVALLSFAVDISLFFIVYQISASPLVSLICARMVSGGFNFWQNKYHVYRSLNRNVLITEAVKYTLLALCTLALSYMAIQYLRQYDHVNIILARVITDIILFATNFVIQQFIFKYGKIKMLLPYFRSKSIEYDAV